MRDKFKDLFKNAGNEIGCRFGLGSKDMSVDDLKNQRMDAIIQQYNTNWGLATNTRLNKSDCPECDYKYFITGSFVSSPNWAEFVCSRQWGGFRFGFYQKDAGMCEMALLDWCEQLGFSLGFGYVGGDKVAVLAPKAPVPETIKLKKAYYTTESRIPRPLTELVRTDDGLILLGECKNSEEILKVLNSGRVIGDEWRFFENKFIGKYGNKMLIVEGDTEI